MDKFCTSCGAALTEADRFCNTCGAETNTTMPTKAQTAGDAASEAAKVIASQAPNEPPSRAKQLLGGTGRLLGGIVAAPASAGEISFAQALPPIGEIAAAAGPVKLLFGGLKNIFRGFFAAFRDKKRWIPAAVLAVVWLLLTLLPLLGFNPAPVRWLSFLTFANGGTTGGLLGLIGGVVGKGVFAYFLISLVVPPNRGQKPFAGVWGGIGRLIPSIAAKTPVQMSGVLAGMGAALVGYNFMTGSVSIQQSMAGVAALLLSLRALSNRTGFLYRFFGSLTKGLRKNNQMNPDAATRLLAGWTAGFALALPLSAVPYAQSGYALGALLLLTAIILKIVSGSKKEVTP